jgi:hypothetical protein
MEISQETIAQVLQLGGQYAIPTAALLRAIYSGWKGKLPDGFRDIAAASLFAGVSAVADNKQPNLAQIVLDLMGNTVFMAGLLSFILLYLLRQPNRGLIFDAVVGSVIGLIAWAIWVYILGNDLRLGSLLSNLFGVDTSSPLVLLADLATWPLAAAGGALAFILLRFSLRQIMRVFRLATYMIVIGLICVAAAGGLYVLQLVTSAPA